MLHPSGNSWLRKGIRRPRVQTHLPPPPFKSGAVQFGRSARRAVEPLGEFDDQAFGSADVAEEVRVHLRRTQRPPSGACGSEPARSSRTASLSTTRRINKR